MKLRDSILIGVFLAAIVLPSGVQLANRAAPHKRPPARPASWAELVQFPRRFARYYGATFGLRTAIVQFHAHAVYRLTGQSPSNKVIFGKDGWLYYADDYSIEDFHSAKPFTPDELACWKSVMEARQDWLARRGAQLLIVLACDKYVIYPEYLPDAYRRGPQPYRVEELAAYLAQHSRLNVVPLLAPLRAARAADRLYHRTDTHWNDRGAAIGYREILGRLNLTPVPYEPAEATTPAWDLAVMINLHDILREQNLALRPVQPRRAKLIEVDTPDPTWNVGRAVFEVDDPALPKLVMFRDSFGSALLPFLAEHFRRSVFLWQYDFDPAVIEAEKPDVVIWLMTSRRLQWYEPLNPPLP